MAEAEDEDRALLARIAGGDQEALGVIYRRYLPLLLRWSLRQTGNRELAADLSSEVFAAALLAARRYDPERGASVGAWLLGIANNKLRESRRRKRVEDSSRRRLGVDPVGLTDADLERVDELVGMDDRLQALVAELPTEQRNAVVARIVDERSYEEIAMELRCSESVVRQRVSRGLKTLRSELESE
jgi:RNA polymerase sigma factor (sigma-70 family)